MEWRWTGHAVISPGFRVTFETVRRVYCRVPITAEDTAVLAAMGSSPQLENGSRFLLKLLGPKAVDRLAAGPLREEVARDIADPGMVWNPANSSYVLKGGC